MVPSRYIIRIYIIILYPLRIIYVFEPLIYDVLITGQLIITTRRRRREIIFRADNNYGIGNAYNY